MFDWHSNIGEVGQWRRYVEAQRRVPPLGKKENDFFGEKEIREIFLFAKKVPLDILVFEFSYKKPDASWLSALSLRGVPPLN